jgi:predicted deacylase
MKLKVAEALIVPCILVLLSLMAPPPLAGQDALVIRDISVRSGERMTKAITINSKENNTIIPITIVNGLKPGPTLLVLSGVHGSEYSPIIAMQQLAPTLDPKEISGRIIIVHIANMPAYLGRSIYTSPIDNKNLNRLFPGKADGSITERIAYFLTDELYPLADAVLDMHSGDGNEQLRPSWIGYYGKAGSPEVIAKSRAMAHAFGIKHIVEFQWELTDVKDAIWGGSAAIAKNIPSIDVEAGGMGIYDTQAIAQIVTGVRRIMAHMGIIDEVFPALPEANIIIERESINAPEDGAWNPLLDAGKTVQEGDLIGFMTDWYGNRIFEARAPISGLLLLRFESPPTRKGDTLAVIAKIEEKP